MKQYVSAQQQQFRDSLATSIGHASSFTDDLKMSGPPADVRTTLSTKFAAMQAYPKKMGQLVDKGSPRRSSVKSPRTG